MQSRTHTETRQDELSIIIVDGRIVHAARTVSTQNPDGGWDNEISDVGCISSPASTDEATRLLMKCRYPRADKECVIMRRPVDDPERIEHEAYFAAVEQYVATLGINA